MAEHDYIATLRVGYQADDDARAHMIAHQMANLLTTEMLDEEAGDEVIVTQVIDYDLPDTTQEMRLIFAKARNALIKTKRMQMIELARELDKVIFALGNGDYDSVMPYDYGRFMTIMENVLKGENDYSA